jgi:hypothetical protein
MPAARPRGVPLRTDRRAGDAAVTSAPKRRLAGIDEVSGPSTAGLPALSPRRNVLDRAPLQRCVLAGTTSNPAMYAGEWLAAVPFHVQGGPELRAALADLTERMTAALGRPPDNQRLPRARSRAGDGPG